MIDEVIIEPGGFVQHSLLYEAQSFWNGATTYVPGGAMYLNGCSLYSINAYVTNVLHAFVIRPFP